MKCPLKTRRGELRVLEFACAPSASGPGELRAHIQECAGCTRLVRSQRAVSGLLGEWELSGVSQDFDRNLYGRIEQMERESWWARFSRAASAWLARPALPLAAASLLIVAGFFLDLPLNDVPLNRIHIQPPAPVVVVAPDAAAPGNAVQQNDAQQSDSQQINEAFDDLQLLHQLDADKDEAADASNAM